jgi:flagellin
MSVINTNMKSLVAANAMTVNNRSLSTAMEQLSTGKRINSSKDDAAGLAISNRMTSQIRGLNQAVRNANDGISLLQTAEGAMVEVTNMMQRMRELAVQSSNDTNSPDDRKYLQMEFAALSKEISRVRETTQFNGMSLLNGDGKFTFQIGANASQTVSVDIADIAATASGGTVITPTLTEPDGTNGMTAVVDFAAENTTAAYETGDKIFLTIGDTKLSYTITDDDVADFAAVGDNNDDGVGDLLSTKLAAMINSNADLQGKVNATVLADGSNELTVTGVDVDDPFTFAVSSSAVTSIAPTTTAADGTNGQVTILDFAAENTASAYETGDKISLQVGGVNFSYTISDEDVADFAAAGDNNDDGVGDLLSTKLAAMINSNATLQGKINATVLADGSNELTLTGVDLVEAFTVEASSTSATASGVTGDISTQSGANSAIDGLTASIDSIDEQRAQLGAHMNRLTYAADNLANISMNTSESRSRIMDADYSKTTSDLARAQIISQAATAMLAQANQAPQSVLSLLR